MTRVINHMHKLMQHNSVSLRVLANSSIPHTTVTVAASMRCKIGQSTLSHGAFTGVCVCTCLCTCVVCVWPDKVISCWHEIPLWASEEELHFVCEIPKETSAKMEVATVSGTGWQRCSRLIIN